ncbi:chemotaxis protein CheW, partial [Aduncisulcus paluster]
ALAHAGETLMGKFRDGMPVRAEAVTLILSSIDRIKEILAGLEATEAEPEGNDRDLIDQLEAMVERGMAAMAAGDAAAEEDVPVVEAPSVQADMAEGTLVVQTLERPLRPGEVSLDELERAFRETETEVAAPAPAPAAKVVAAAPAAEPAEAAKKPARKAAAEDVQEGDKIANQSIRVNVDTLEHLMTMVSELVLTRNQLLEISRRNEDTEFKVPLQRLSNVTAELQEGVMKTRMQPIGNAWQKLPRIVRDLSGELGKQIELEMHGADTELDRQVLDLIKDPLTHMVRNSADHGLETTAERLAAGKPEQGTIRLTQVTSVSGRGVGMDVVRTNIDQIGGTIDIKSVAGEGASVTIKIPLTLAIVSALIVEAGGDRFAIPQLSVVELVRARANSEHRIERIKDTAVLRLRNKLLPLIHLKKLLRIDDGATTTSDAENGFIVVTQVGSQTFGIVVDGVFHTEEIVVKPMSTKLRHIDMFSGNTILGDGAVIMIIDPNGIAKALGAS